MKFKNLPPLTQHELIGGSQGRVWDFCKPLSRVDLVELAESIEIVDCANWTRAHLEYDIWRRLYAMRRGPQQVSMFDLISAETPLFDD